MQSQQRPASNDGPGKSSVGWRNLFEDMREGFFVAEAVRDASGRMVDFRYIEVNPAFEAITEVRVTDAVGHTGSQTIAGLPQQVIDIFRDVVETAQPTEFEIQVAALGNRWFEARARSLGDDLFSVLFLDITARKKALAKLVQSEERFRLLADASPHMLWIADLDGTAEYFNRAWDQYTGIDHRREHARDVVGKYIHPDDRAITLARFGQALKTFKPFEVEHRIRSAQGDYRWFLVRAEPYFDPLTGRPVRWYGSSVDIHDSKLAHDALRESQEALRTADRRKDEFLATLAHELRNPLAPLRNGLHIARLLVPADSRVQRTVQMMDRQLTHLVRLVDDLMDVGRVTSGKLALQRRPVSLRTVLADSLEATRAAIEAHEHQVVVDAGDGDLKILGDADRLTQVLVNLLTNSVKYTPRGGRIGIRLGRQDEHAVLSIEDNGIGIPPENLSDVFQLFSQVRVHQCLAEGGLGIGLALVRSLVALHGGTVEAHSEGPGRGSVFTVRLPLNKEATLES